MARELPSASLLENARFNALIVIPNAVQGLFRRRSRAMGAATRANVDRWAVGLLAGMRRGHGPGPVWVRVVRDRALLLLSRDDVRRVLEGSPHPFAPDPEAKRKGMSAFQPDALTLSRGQLWENRRRFTEAVLDTGQPLHRLAGRFAAVAREEADALLREVEVSDGGKLDWERWHGAFRRLTRRIMLGDAAREDEELSELLGDLMSEGNGLPGKPSERYEPFIERIRAYVSAGEEGSLASLIGEAPADDDTRVEGQIPHWLFATQDTLAINAFRALALLASHPRQRAKVADELAEAGGGGVPEGPFAVGGLTYLEACLEEAMRLWPTTPMLSRETLTDIDWDGTRVPAGTQLLFVNIFLHRDRENHEFADHFAPEAWIEGDAADDWSFNHFSHGPQGCPGAGLALFMGKAVLGTILAERQVRLLQPSLDPGRPLPHMLDFFRLRFEVR